MKKERVDGKVVLVYEKGDGIRRRFREALHEDRFRFPRKGLVHHAEVWYLTDAPLKRPMFGIYALAAYAEDILWRARFGKNKRPDINEAIKFFAETRRALQNVLSTYRLGERLTRKQIASQRKVVTRLVESAKKFISIADH
jgi:hypothetical protein